MRRFSESPSSLSTYTGCPQRYLYKYKEKLPDPAGAAAETGKLFHNAGYASWDSMSAEHPDEQISKMLKALYQKPEVQALPHPKLIHGKNCEMKITANLGIQNLYGIIDIAIEDIAIDFKTSGKAWDAAKVEDATQHLAYTYALRQLKLSPVRRFYYIVVTTAKNPQCQVIELDVSQEACERYAETARGAVKRIGLDLFMPTPTPRMCGWCNFKGICPAFK
jgi:CRISPR/Cas system-associated exonuclease Cas4 (RecB family)